ncbi:MAG: hypothetical protein KJ550_11340 [Proteobacteria bacterium]|nr:hypothetical protein [Desulfobacteraceae bacterium]MBU3981218.1 hypothetical protein [Pseudomonadota bacterium]MBU4014048.1 hypothetical protein [Pseudomonadota bacterium]MBU4066846.1 hypothetical protein [Pseudomonadota bacterium]MBU4127970.1 hypothetical protein [Pseudomonadota bacterium]
MNSKKTEIDKLKDEEKFSWKKDLPLFVILAIFYSIFLNLPNIVDSLNLIDPPLANNFQKIIKQAFSYRDDFLICILFFIIFIILSIIWPFFRKHRIRLKIIKLIENELDKCRSDNKNLEISLRLQSQKQSINANIYITPSPDKPSASEKSMYFKATPVKHSSPETENYTGHTTPIDSDKIETLDIANDTADRHNEDQE